MNYYVYQITNQINGRFYIGVRKYSGDPLDDPYMGSGKALRNAYRKYGRKNFTKIVLEVYDNERDMFAAEARIVNDEFLKNPLVYNIVPGGSGGWKVGYLTESEQSEWKLKIREANNRRYNMMSKNELSEKYGSRGPNNHFFGKTHSEDSKIKIRDANAVYSYSIISPSGETFETISLNDFCKTHKLNRDTLMYFMGKGKVPPSSNVGSKSTTWRSGLRENTTGWSASKTSITSN